MRNYLQKRWKVYKKVVLFFILRDFSKNTTFSRKLASKRPEPKLITSSETWPLKSKIWSKKKRFHRPSLLDHGLIGTTLRYFFLIINSLNYRIIGTSKSFYWNTIFFFQNFNLNLIIQEYHSVSMGHLLHQKKTFALSIQACHAATLWIRMVFRLLFDLRI